MWHWLCPHGMTLLSSIGTRSTTRVKRATRIGADQEWQRDLRMKRGVFMAAKHQSQPHACFDMNFSHIYQNGCMARGLDDQIGGSDEASAHIKPRRAMAVLMNVGKPLQTSDDIFTTEWVVIFRESGLRDDVTVANLQDAFLKLVLLARARARELQVDQQVERAQQLLSAKTATPTTKPKPKSAAETDKPVCRFFLKSDGCNNRDNCQYAHPCTNGKCLQCGSESHNLQACTRPRRQQSSRSSSAKTAKSKGKDHKTKPTAKSGEVDFDENAQAEQDEPDEPQEHDEDREEDPEAYLADGQFCWEWYGVGWHAWLGRWWVLSERITPGSRQSENPANFKGKFPAYTGVSAASQIGKVCEIRQAIKLNLGVSYLLDFMWSLEFRFRMRLRFLYFRVNHESSSFQCYLQTLPRFQVGVNRVCQAVFALIEDNKVHAISWRIDKITFACYCCLCSTLRRAAVTQGYTTPGSLSENSEVASQASFKFGIRVIRVILFDVSIFREAHIALAFIISFLASTAFPLAGLHGWAWPGWLLLLTTSLPELRAGLSSCCRLCISEPHSRRSPFMRAQSCIDYYYDILRQS